MAQAIRRPPHTLQDYLALPDDVRAELIGGDLFVTPAPTTRHQDVLGSLYMSVQTWAEAQHVGRAYLAPIDVHLPTGDVVQPDLLLIRSERFDIVRDDAIHGAPDLAVEILSPSNPERDRIVKRGLYAASGVPEYWIVDPDARSVEVFRIEADRYAPAGWFTGDATLSSPTLPGLLVPLRKVFR